ncbi:MAG: CDP-alcohol phosphatidyltransferase family protein [Deltaproteobacteria bacterium]|nr:CDP-alcohol phosphatidyltransferase family protein [Deltaproteobacteria bacterium]
MTFSEFQSKTLSVNSVFKRENFDPLTNAIKWLGLRFAYLLHKIGISANAVDMLGIFLSFLGFTFMLRAVSGEKLLPLAGLLILYFHVFLDFVDGAIARAQNTLGPIGAILDELGCFVDRVALLILLGIFAGHSLYVLGNVFAAGILLYLLPSIRANIPKRGLVGIFCRICCNKYSLLSVRFMLALLPLFIVLTGYLGISLEAVSRFISTIYITIAVFWCLALIPTYPVINPKVP